jgi:hypothetical protein
MLLANSTIGASSLLVVRSPGTWHSTVKAWGSSHTQMGQGAGSTGGGAMIPVQAVYDLVGNLFNVQASVQDYGLIRFM